jgi:hypothetical protein
VESGLRPRRRYTVGDALDDWLAVGVDGLSARTVTLYRDTIGKTLREELGTVRLTHLTAGMSMERWRLWRRGCLPGQCRSRTTCWCGRSGKLSATIWQRATSRRW